MSPRSKKESRRFAVRFELGLGGMLGLVVVCFCIFLWLFLLGVWAGQTVLSPEATGNNPWMRRFAAAVLPLPPPPGPPPPPVPSAVPTPAAKSVAQPAVEQPAAEQQAGDQQGEDADEPETTDDSAKTAPEESAKPGAVAPEPELAENSFFSLQVAAYREAANAVQAVAAWRGKGYDAFSRPPEEGSSLTRIFVGRFNDLASANKLAAELEEKEKLRAYITLLPAAKE